MSDGSLEKERILPLHKNNETDSAAMSPAKATEKPVEKTSDKLRKPLFGRLNQDLQEALNTWDSLSEEMSQRLSPEEEQLQEVKRLLSELKSKLNEFDEP